MLAAALAGATAARADIRPGDAPPADTQPVGTQPAQARPAEPRAPDPPNPGTLRIASWNLELSARGPGLLLRDILADEAPRVRAAAGILARVNPDLLVLQGIDHDHEGRTLDALADAFGAAGADYPHRFAGRPNAGMATGLDLDGDGRRGDARDAQGYGRFAGAGGMAVLSRLPVDRDGLVDLTPLPWRDLPGADPPRRPDGSPFPSDAAWAVQRLSSVAHWDLPLRLPDGRRLHLLTHHATPPVFDGPEDRNGRRNHDEAAAWLRHLDGALGHPAPAGPLVLVMDANLDLADGDGRPGALRALLAHPRLQDPRPASAGGPAAAAAQGGVNAAHAGDPALDTADWDDAPGGPGNLRVSYVLPSRDLRVVGAGVFWPAPGTPDAALLAKGDAAASRHHLVWVDVAY